MEATLIATNKHGKELRYARRLTDTWPGEDESAPLMRGGYWFGTHGDYHWLGRHKPSPGWLKENDFDRAQV